jgi:hypothetical protein
MIHTCWLLADMPEYIDHGLRRWSYALGYPGHFLTKSRRYSTTFGAIRGARADHRATKTAPPPGLMTATKSEYAFAGQEHLPTGISPTAGEHTVDDATSAETVHGFGM